MDKNTILLIMFICLVYIALIIIGNAPKELALLPIIPLHICTYLLYHDDWHNDSGAVG